MANPNYFKLRDYLQSLIDMTIEAENKNSIYYYFPIDSRDLAKNMELIKMGIIRIYYLLICYGK